jgi:hypothetical protein
VTEKKKRVWTGAGVYSRPTGGRLVTRQAPPARASIVDEGIEFEPVWFPHRDAASLLPEDESAGANHTTTRGRLVGQHAKSQPWSWQG